MGTRIALDHTKPSAVGSDVTCTATVAEIDGRIITFKATQQLHGEDV